MTEEYGSKYTSCRLLTGESRRRRDRITCTVRISLWNAQSGATALYPQEAKMNSYRRFPSCWGILDGSGSRLYTLLFEWAVEPEMTMSDVATARDGISLRELRRYAVEEVKRTNGQLSFDESLRTQRLPLHPDGEWRG